MKLKKLNVINIYKTINEIKKLNVRKSAKYIYKTVKILKTLESEISALAEIEPKKRKEYGDKQVEIYKNNLDTNENGDFILKSGEKPRPDIAYRFDELVIENPEKLRKELDELNYKTDFEAIQKEELEYTNILNEEIEIDLVKLDYEDVELILEDLKDGKEDILIKLADILN